MFYHSEIYTTGFEFITSSATRELKVNGHKLHIGSNLIKQGNNILDFKDGIKQLVVTNYQCSVLLQDGSAYNYNFVKELLIELTLPNCENLKEIANTFMCTYGVTQSNFLYELQPSLKAIHNFPKHQNIRKISAGVEHVLLLTSNGDIFSMGCGLRGQLGHGDISSCTIPKQIEALAGLKVIDIAAGGFHSAAVSSFGDVYIWGWNTNGQLGLPKAPQTFKRTAKCNSIQQVFTLPQLIEMTDEVLIKNVYCGHKHTLLRTEENKIFSTGLNKFGQLGLNDNYVDHDKFLEMSNIANIGDDANISCGYWTTYLINMERK